LRCWSAWWPPPTVSIVACTKLLNCPSNSLFPAANRSLKQYGGGGGTTEGETTTEVPLSGVTGGATGTTSAITSTAEGLSVNPWMLNQNFGDQTVTVGQQITFTWPQGNHGVYVIPSRDCPTTFQDGQNGQKEIQAGVQGPKTVNYTFEQAGTVWFACPVDGHCDGMKFKVTVT
jgi:plastocyanin